QGDRTVIGWRHARTLSRGAAAREPPAPENARGRRSDRRPRREVALWLVARERLDEPGRHEDDQLTVLTHRVVRTEQVADERQIHQQRHAGPHRALVRADQAADDRGLAIVHHHARVGLARVDDDTALDRALRREVAYPRLS